MLVIARTFTSLIRVLESLDVFRDDFRLRLRFCFDDTSAFRRGVAELLSRLETPQVAWDEAVKGEYDLIITASENVDLSPFAAPVVVLPHGVGFQKHVPDSHSDGRRLSGVVPEASRNSADVRPVVSHPDQRERLRSISPRLAGHTTVIGDLAYDRVRAGLRLRDRYRDALGVAPDERLVVLTSTWKDESAVGVRNDLPARLLAGLPVDGHRVATVLHPNIWFEHGPWEVRRFYRSALEAGLLLLPPDDGWGAALAAADCVIGDHGSVTLYAAGADRPLLLAAFGDEAVPGTAIARLAEQTGRLDLRAPLGPQIDRAVAAHVPGQHRATVDRAFAHVGEAAARFSAMCYGLLGLDAPEGGARTLAPGPPVPRHHRGVTAFEVRSHIDPDGDVHVARYPAAVRSVREEPDGLRHLCVAESETDSRFADNASVVHLDAEPAGPADAERRRLLDLFPAALLSATPVGGGCDCLVRGGGTVRVRSAAGTALPTLTGVVYTLLRTGRLTNGDVRLRLDGVPGRAAATPIRVDVEPPPG
ncbi:hypothetical protein ACFOVU_25945 [Nocardiopsis sediminis]|uniref:Translation initiation factor 2 n=1 Tax=Nocardiopsis sediminis TaxID=1778267 RepID=A0ABV8FTC7_9ACTN